MEGTRDGEMITHNNGTSQIAPESLGFAVLQKINNGLSRFIQFFPVKDRSGCASLSPYENAQRQRVLATMLKVIIVSGVALFLVNLYIQAWNIAFAVLSMTFFCVPALWLNSRGHYILSASLTLAVILCVADYNLYATGGLQDSGVLAYPLIIIVGSLFFGKRAIPVLTFASIGSLALLAYLEIKGIFSPAPVATDAGFCLSAGILLMAASGLVWVVIHNTESNIAHIKQAEAELLKTYNLTLEGLAKVLEYRDSETEPEGRQPECEAGAGHGLQRERDRTDPEGRPDT